LEAFLSLRAFLGWTSTAGLMVFSFWFPGYYWGKIYSQERSDTPLSE
jgi:hypothetical protein